MISVIESHGYGYNLIEENSMGRCINHPEVETSYNCMKHNVYLCGQCLKCRDPEIYCKFRPSCTIWFMSRAGDSLDEKKPGQSFLPSPSTG